MKRSALPIAVMTGLALTMGACAMGEKSGRDQQQTSSAGQAPAGMAAGGQQQAVSSELIRDVQARLGQRGFDVGPVDGVYGDSTQQALRNFQKSNNIQATGQIDSRTLAALGVTQGSMQRAQAGQQAPAAERPYQPMERRATAPEQRSEMRTDQQQRRQQQTSQAAPADRETVRNVQQALEQQGYDVGQVDGVWGRRTADALRNFQRDQNLRGEGRIDQETLAALGVEEGRDGQQTGQVPEERGDIQRTPPAERSPAQGEPDPDPAGRPDTEAMPEIAPSEGAPE